ncbi:equilibrative nucleoside transporter 3-like isoform X2 [Cylas formicarius]|uniref:equilibrative nucleoside transporter 3-like isoform X2 n=1 Tax=Cylas formicarius TaxID=197179 RepID=UPI002958D997|nr:equilibrative nucleoside transporter 3-like isoform X2 [Cylas formicarius]
MNAETKYSKISKNKVCDILHSNYILLGEDLTAADRLLLKPLEIGRDVGEEKKVPWEAEPKDRFYFVGVVLFILGTVNTLPGSFLANANEYWMYKLRNTSLDHDDPNNRPFLQKNFATFQSFAIILPMIVMYFIAAFVGHKIRPKTKALIFLCPIILIFFVHTLLVNVNTDGVVTGIGAVGCLTLASSFPSNYTKCFLVGQGLAGIFTSVIRIISIASAPSTVDAAFIYFVTGTVTMAIGTVLFVMASKTPFFRYHLRDIDAETKRKVNSIGAILRAVQQFWKVLLLNVIGIIFPIASIVNLVVSEYKGTGNTWGDWYFVTVATFLIPAICEITGKLLATLIDKDYPWWFLYIGILIKSLLLGPMIFFSNAQPRSHTPVVFKHDWQYIIIMILNSLWGAYLGNVLMLKLIRLIPKDKLDLLISVDLLFAGLVAIATAPLGLIIVAML